MEDVSVLSSLSNKTGYQSKCLVNTQMCAHCIACHILQCNNFLCSEESADDENELKALLDEALALIAKVRQSSAIRRRKEKEVADAYSRLSEVVEKDINSVYNRICNLRDRYNDRLKTMEEEMTSTNAALSKRALQFSLMGNHIHHELRRIERNIFVLQVYNRICNLRDRYNDRLKTMEEEMTSTNAALSKRALQFSLMGNHIHHELRRIERNIFVLQSAAREFLHVAYKYLSEMNIGEVREQVEEANVHVRIVDRMLNERRRTPQTLSAEGLTPATTFENALKQCDPISEDVSAALQFLSKLQKACRCLDRLRRMPYLSGESANEASVQGELFVKEAHALSAKLALFCKRLILNTVDEPQNSNAVQPVQSPIEKKFDQQSDGIAKVHDAGTPKSEPILSPSILSDKVLRLLAEEDSLNMISLDDLNTVQ
ncbi:hypothetical protein Tcan_06344 [Toxocara canis]|uniref:Uncharacterized protein n=1 Tax=Toxocara canis TaxID=6265 RepID=A0A0B2V463_TOXCA|nr:hypothetical protein Tcan_06344 [Toxocara canis]